MPWRGDDCVSVLSPTYRFQTQAQTVGAVKKDKCAKSAATTGSSKYTAKLATQVYAAAEGPKQQVLSAFMLPYVRLLSRLAESLQTRQNTWQGKWLSTENWTTAWPKLRYVLSIGMADSCPKQFALHGLDGGDVKTEELVYDVAEGGEDVKLVMPSVTVHLLFVRARTFYLFSFVHLGALWERWRRRIYRPG